MLTVKSIRRGESWVMDGETYIGCWLGEIESIRDLVRLSNEDDARRFANNKQLQIPAVTTNDPLSKAFESFGIGVVDVTPARGKQAEATLEQYGDLATKEE